MAEPRPVTVLDEIAVESAALVGAGATTVTLLPPATQVVLRLSPERQPEALLRLTGAIGSELALEPNTVRKTADGRRKVLWLGPEEWLVEAPFEEATTLLDELGAAAGPEVTVVDLSANWVRLALCGPDAGEVLSTVCALDLRPRSLRPGACAQTLVARVPVILEPDGEDGFVLRVRPSFSPHLFAWLADAVQTTTRGGTS